MKLQHYRSIPKSKAKGIKTKRPRTFCNKDHWDNECQVYSTVKQRTKRLKELKEFELHKTTDRKRSCFYCKGPHNTALCEEKYQGHDESKKEEAKSVNVNITNKNQTDQREKEVLLLCRKVNVINPVNQEIQSEAIVLFDTGAQTSFEIRDSRKAPEMKLVFLIHFDLQTKLVNVVRQHIIDMHAARRRFSSKLFDDDLYYLFGIRLFFRLNRRKDQISTKEKNSKSKTISHKFQPEFVLTDCSSLCINFLKLNTYGSEELDVLANTESRYKKVELSFAIHNEYLVILRQNIDYITVAILEFLRKAACRIKRNSMQ
ncbi:unnamed protein product [Dracunculus medinensis]|uniref:DUF1758 domain-containing protein n=1 Tax=Dracunculus medinensis TaxID=318479 RepID=A0A0N4UGU9_DRAME|nr:unnamed protein product [Dracunculus medinensis]